MRVNRVSPTQPVTHGYYRQPEQPQTKVIDARAKVEEYQPDALDWLEATKPICDRITRAAIVGTVIFLAVHVLIWVLR